MRRFLKNAGYKAPFEKEVLARRAKQGIEGNVTPRTEQQDGQEHSWREYQFFVFLPLMFLPTRVSTSP